MHAQNSRQKIQYKAQQVP